MDAKSKVAARRNENPIQAQIQVGNATKVMTRSLPFGPLPCLVFFFSTFFPAHLS